MRASPFRTANYPGAVRSGTIFDYGITHDSPTIKSGRINRVLVYPESFNPPHREHFELLRHEWRSGRDTNILDDEYLTRRKYVDIHQG